MPIYRIADLTIEFEPYIESLAKLAEPYRIDGGVPDIKVELTREDIQKEKEIFKDASNANLVYTAIYRKICTRIPCIWIYRLENACLQCKEQIRKLYFKACI